MKSLSPKVLIISSLHDYSTDHITTQLSQTKTPYLRLNRDQLKNYKISFFPLEKKIEGEIDQLRFTITEDSLLSIFFRSPTFLRNIPFPGMTPDDQLDAEQWSSFTRDLMVFDKVKWVNHPQATYKAESKPYQLSLASTLGFLVPKTIIANTIQHLGKLEQDSIIIKTLTPSILHIDGKETFTYTHRIPLSDLKDDELRIAPAIFQEALIPKTDLRVTVIGENIFAISITKNGKGIDQDWRLEKNNVQYKEYELPKTIEKKCILLTKQLGLSFGCIDLIKMGEEYYFIEINPTGEWGWILKNTSYQLDRVIMEFLCE